MSEMLPEAFKERMHPLLPDDFQTFLDSFDQPRTRGLRLNPSKIAPNELAELLGTPLEPVPWCPAGFTFSTGVRLGGHPAHLAGLFYLQEPSSMSPAEALEPEVGWSVIDLAAAPGGKTTHLSDLVGAGGLVVANEVVGSRLRPLHDNLDLWGAQNAVTASHGLRQLADVGVQFDGAVLDAPCSGEGLFRRSPASIREWSPATVRGSARRQRQLLAEAARLVRPGGVLVYSTCTFELEENEERIAEFLQTSPGWTLGDVCRWRGVVPGLSLPPAPTERTARLWPHRAGGEGQFVARLLRTDVAEPHEPVAPPTKARGKQRRGSRTSAQAGGVSEREVLGAWLDFREASIPGFDAPDERVLVRDDRVFLVPQQQPALGADVLARPGLPLGRLRPGRFEPHPALATAVSPGDVTQLVSWGLDSAELAAFLRGETAASAGQDGWVLVTFEKWGIGWAKRSRGVLKNTLPPHLRQQATRWSAKIS